MPTIPCHTKINQCLPCNDDPIENFSSEAPDVAVFVANVTVPIGGGGGRLGRFQRQGCVGICTSTVSQAEADQCAADQAFLCSTPPGTLVFPSEPQTCTVNCPDGLPFSWTVVPGGDDGSTGLLVIPSPNTGPGGSGAGGIGPIMPVNPGGGTPGAAGGTPPPQIPPAYVPPAGPLYITTLEDLGAIRSFESGTYTPFFSKQIGRAGGVEPFLWALVDGSLPAGVMLDAHSGLLSGSPSTGGFYSFTIRVTDGQKRTSSKKFLLQVEQIVSGLQLVPDSVERWLLPAGHVGQTYDAGIDPFTMQPILMVLKAIGTTDTLIWKLNDGSWDSGFPWFVNDGRFPPGLRLDQVSGLISGTPTMADDFDFAVLLYDLDGFNRSDPTLGYVGLAVRNFRIQIHP